MNLCLSFAAFYRNLFFAFVFFLDCSYSLFKVEAVFMKHFLFSHSVRFLFISVANMNFSYLSAMELGDVQVAQGLNGRKALQGSTRQNWAESTKNSLGVGASDSKEKKEKHKNITRSRKPVTEQGSESASDFNLLFSDLARGRGAKEFHSKRGKKNGFEDYDQPDREIPSPIVFISTSLSINHDISALQYGALEKVMTESFSKFLQTIENEQCEVIYKKFAIPKMYSKEDSKKIVDFERKINAIKYFLYVMSCAGVYALNKAKYDFSDYRVLIPLGLGGVGLVYLTTWYFNQLKAAYKGQFTEVYCVENSEQKEKVETQINAIKERFKKYCNESEIGINDRVPTSITYWQQ